MKRKIQSTLDEWLNCKPSCEPPTKKRRHEDSDDDESTIFYGDPPRYDRKPEKDQKQLNSWLGMPSITDESSSPPRVRPEGWEPIGFRMPWLIEYNFEPDTDQFAFSHRPDDKQPLSIHIVNTNDCEIDFDIMATHEDDDEPRNQVWLRDVTWKKNKKYKRYSRLRLDRPGFELSLRPPSTQEVSSYIVFEIDFYEGVAISVRSPIIYDRSVFTICEAWFFEREHCYICLTLPLLDRIRWYIQTALSVPRSILRTSDGSCVDRTSVYLFECPVRRALLLILPALHKRSAEHSIGRFASHPLFHGPAIIESIFRFM